MLDLIPLAIFDASSFFQWFVENASYLFVFLFMMIESSFIPFPSEVVVPPAAYLACRNYGVGADMNVYMVVVVATLGALAGAFVNYFLALWVGRPVVYRFADSKFGHACLIDRAKVEKAENYFDRHGAVSTLVGRLIPAVRQLISIPAGLAKMARSATGSRSMWIPTCFSTKWRNTTDTSHGEAMRCFCSALSSSHGKHSAKRKRIRNLSNNYTVENQRHRRGG